MVREEELDRAKLAETGVSGRSERVKPLLWDRITVHIVGKVDTGRKIALS